MRHVLRPTQASDTYEHFKQQEVDSRPFKGKLKGRVMTEDIVAEKVAAHFEALRKAEKSPPLAECGDPAEASEEEDQEGQQELPEFMRPKAKKKDKERRL